MFQLENPISMSLSRQEMRTGFTGSQLVSISQALVLQMGRVTIDGVHLLCAQTLPFYNIRGFAEQNIKLGETISYGEEMVADVDLGPIRYGTFQGRSNAGPYYIGIGSNVRQSDKEYLEALAALRATYSQAVSGKAFMKPLQEIKEYKAEGTIMALCDPSNLPDKISWAWQGKQITQRVRAISEGVVHLQDGRIIIDGEFSIKVRPGFVPVVQEGQMVVKGDLLVQITQTSVTDLWESAAQALLQAFKAAQRENMICPLCQKEVKGEVCQDCDVLARKMYRTYIHTGVLLCPEDVPPFPLSPLRTALKKLKLKSRQDVIRMVEAGHQVGKFTL